MRATEPRHPSPTRLLPLLVAAAIAALAAAGCFTSREPSGQATLPPELHLGVGESETHGNVTVTLVEASFSSSDTRLVFDIEDHLTPAGQASEPYLVIPDVSYSGFASQGYPMLSTQATGPHTARNTVRLGPVEAAEKPVVFHIGVVGLDFERGGEDDVTGPWHFEFIPGQAAVDPINFDVAVNQTACADEICISVDRLHFSTPAVDVHYRLESNKEGFRGAPGYPVRMIFADGTWAPGNGTSDPNQLTGSETAAFEPLPAGVRTFKLAFGPYLADLPGPFDISVPVGGKLPRTPAAVAEEATLDYGTTLANEEFVVKSLVVDQQGFELRLENVNQKARSVVQASYALIDASDDRGNSYSWAGGGEAFGEDALGSMTAESIGIRFEGKLDPQAQVLRLRIDGLGKLLYGPWEFDVAIPEGQLVAP